MQEKLMIIENLMGKGKKNLSTLNFINTNFQENITSESWRTIISFCYKFFKFCSNVTYGFNLSNN